jgi:hypothetical protein
MPAQQASASLRSYSSDTMAFNRPMYAPSSTGVINLTDEWMGILVNNLNSGEVMVEMLFCNRAADATFSVAIVPQGETAGVEWLIYDEVPIAGQETLVPPFKPTLRPGDTLYAMSSSDNTVNLFCNYLSEQ